MNFTQIVAEVMQITKRPDLLNDTRREVNSAINFCCLEANFARDFVEDSYTIDNTLYQQSILLSEFERWRKFRYVRPVNRKCYIEQLAPEKVFSPSGREQCDVYYVQGDSVVFKLKELSSALLIGHFRYPPILTDASPDFWLLDISPYMIIDKAAAKIFKNVGNNTEATLHEAEFRVSFTSAMRDYKYGADYG